MKLYLMRHGEAAPPQVDPERGLTENGKNRIQELANHLKDKDIRFSQALHSEKKRARETAEIMTRTLAPGVTPATHSNISPNDEPEIFYTELMSWEEDTLVASHLPFVPNLLTILTGKDAFILPITFETGTLICLEKTANGGWEIAWSACPSDL